MNVGTSRELSIIHVTLLKIANMGMNDFSLGCGDGIRSHGSHLLGHLTRRGLCHCPLSLLLRNKAEGSSLGLF